MICKIMCYGNLREINSYIAFYYPSISFFSFVIILVFHHINFTGGFLFCLFHPLPNGFSFILFIFFYFFIQNYTVFLFLYYSTFTIISFTYFLFCMSTFLKIHSWHHQIISLSFTKKRGNWLQGKLSVPLKKTLKSII